MLRAGGLLLPEKSMPKHRPAVHSKSRCIALALLLLWGSAGAASPGSPPDGAVHLVHDFFPGEFESDRPLPQLTKAGNALFFIGADLETGHSVWRTDGTAAGTGRVPIPDSFGVLEDPKILGVLGGRVLWMANLAITRIQVIFAAGENGEAVALYTGSFGPTPRILGERLFFPGCDHKGCPIWSTDGSVAGTKPVPALAAQSARGTIFETLADRWLVFRAGPALLAYDVKQARVLPLLSIRGEVSDVFPVGKTLFVIIRGRQDRVWASHLGSPGATLVFTGPEIAVAGWKDGRLYFVDGKKRLWSTDGHRAGTHPYKGLQADTYRLLADQLGPAGSTTLIPMPGYYGAGLIAADEASHELTEILPVCTGKYECLGIRMSAFALAGDRVFEEIQGRLAHSDGTPEGTGYGTGLVGVDDGSFGVADGRLLLGAVRQGVRQLWETDGTAAGTRALTDGTRDRPFRVQGPPISFNGTLFVAADRKPVGQQLWRVAGGRTAPMTDLKHLATGIGPYQAFSVGDRVGLNGGESNGWAAVAGDGSVEALPDYGNPCQDSLDPCTVPSVRVGRRVVFAKVFPSELWSTDGTAADTVPVKSPDGGILEVIALGRLGDLALILTRDGGLWSSDGSSSGATQFIARLPTNPRRPERYAPLVAPVSLGSSTFLFRRAPGPAGPPSSVLEVWRTDGTAAGTLRLATTPFPDGFSPALSPAVVGGRLFFRFGGTLWMSDGSVEGTHPLPEQLPGGTFALVAGSGILYAGAGYQGDDPTHETLWAIDPTTLAASLLGTFDLLDTGATGANLGSVVGDTLFFGVADPQDPRGIETVWLTEGTAASTRRPPAPLADLTAAAFSTVGDRRYFTACEAEHGCELWSTGRLGEDSRLVADLWPGSRSSDPEILAVDDKSLLFAATEPTTGRELWKLDRSALSAALSPEGSATRAWASSKPLVSPRRAPERKRSGPHRI
jgi:ELWxxDGT repeat protein